MTAIHVRKARRRSVCCLCHGLVQVGQQISDATGGWSHTRCLIQQRREAGMEISYGEVGHDPPVHAVEGTWQGPPSVSRQAARNVSLCGRPLSRMRKNAPKLDDLCRKCEADMAQMAAPAVPPGPQKERPMPAADFQPEYEARHVPLSALFVDPAVQRPMQEPWSKKISGNFSPVRFADNPPKVSLRPPGRRGPDGELYHVMDGQHEIDAARRAGYPPDTQVPVHIYRGLDAKQEAEKFLDLNVDRKVVKAISRFPVAVIAGDPQAIIVQEALDHYGWQAKSSGAEGGMACVVQLRRLAADPKVLDQVMQTITGAWGIRGGIQGVIVSGLGRIYSRPRSESRPCEVNVQHMIQRLKTVSPETIIGVSKGMGRSPAPVKAANCIIGEYNKYLRTTPKLDLIS